MAGERVATWWSERWQAASARGGGGSGSGGDGGAGSRPQPLQSLMLDDRPALELSSLLTIPTTPRAARSAQLPLPAHWPLLSMLSSINGSNKAANALRMVVRVLATMEAAVEGETGEAGSGVAQCPIISEVTYHVGTRHRHHPPPTNLHHPPPTTHHPPPTTVATVATVATAASASIALHRSINHHDERGRPRLRLALNIDHRWCRW